VSARLESVLGAVLSCAILAAVAPAARAQGADHRDDGAIPARAATTTADSIRYAVKITDNNQFAITVTNYGFIGNNFVSRSSSLEYPAGSGYEHAVRAGLWFGARAIDDNGAFTGVVTGAVDGGQGTGSQSATEFTPAGLEIGIDSALPNSKYYNPNAVSEEDLTASFSDRPAKRSANNAEDHRPMGILVKQQNYMWSFSDYQHLVIFHYTIKNLGPPLANAYVGLYSEYASGSKNAYSSWPPSSSAGPGGWFNKKWIEYDNPLRLFREHFCFYGPIPSGCATWALITSRIRWRSGPTRRGKTSCQGKGDRSAAKAGWNASNRPWTSSVRAACSRATTIRAAGRRNKPSKTQPNA
jgi:hypothetical protein